MGEVGELNEAGLEAAAKAMFDYHHRGAADFDPAFWWGDLGGDARAYWCELAEVALAVSVPAEAQEGRTPNAVECFTDEAKRAYPAPVDPAEHEDCDAIVAVFAKRAEQAEARLSEAEAELEKVKADVVEAEEERDEAREQTAREIAEWVLNGGSLGLRDSILASLHTAILAEFVGSQNG